MSKLVFICIFIFIYSSIQGQHEKLEVDGAIRIGNSEMTPTNPGTIRWNGSDFEGWTGSKWVSLTTQNMFNPDWPEEIQIDSVIFLDSVQSYIVPSGKNFYITGFQNLPSGDPSDHSYEVNGISINGIGTVLGGYYHLILGENMHLTSNNYIKASGHLNHKSIDFIIHDLNGSPYVVPEGKTLWIISYLDLYPIYINGTSILWARTFYSTQTLSSDRDTPAVFIGFLK